MTSEKSKARSIPLFSHQAAPILSQSLRLALSDPATTSASELQGAGNELTTAPPPQSGTNPAPPSEPQCLSCHAFFSSREEQVAHYRLDWHRYNLKRRLSGEAPVGQEEFEKVAGDLSSISGSESDSDDPASHGSDAASSKDTPPTPQLAGSPFLHFITPDDTSYAVYRSILTGPKASATDGVLLDLLGRLLQQSQVWIILMKAGGHFAGAVFRDFQLLAHKTFHRYTVRAQRGTVQSARDSHQGAHKPKSAGASLRRYNEAALEQEIQELVSSWSEYVEQASAIFIRAPKYSKGTFVGGKKSPFSRDDPRLRSIPFSTRRPTLKEVRVVHSKLAALYIQKPHDSMQKSHDSVQKSHNSVQKSHDSMQKSHDSVQKSHDCSSKAHDSWSQTQDSVSSTCLLDENLQSDFDRAGSETGASELPQAVPAAAGQNESTSVVECVDQSSGGGDGASKGKSKKKKWKGDKQKVEAPATSVSPAIPTEAERLLELCWEGGGEALVELLQSMGLRPLHVTLDQQGEESDAMVPETAVGSPESQLREHPLPELLNQLYGGRTALHTAAESGRAEVVRLLLQYGADPAIRDSSGHTPYFLSKDKPVRDSFRRFMGDFPSAYDYPAAQVPSPLTEAMERGRKEKMAERKKAVKKAKKQREKVRRAEQEVVESQRAQDQAVASLSEREKRALAAERRMAQQLPSASAVQRAGMCSRCGCSLAGVVPFERLQFTYCSMACLKEHRAQLGSQ